MKMDLVDERSDAAEAELQAALTVVTDRLLERVARFTEATRQADGPLRADDLQTAQVMLGDLSMIAGAWRALQGAATRRLDAASAELVEASRIVDRALALPNP